MTKISIVVTCFNQQDTIAETLVSVAKQTRTDWECLVVDDGSLDTSRSVIERFVAADARFKYLGKPNGGVASARNWGFARAQGEYLLPLDGDDKLHHSFLDKVMSCFAAHPETVLVHTQTRLFGAKNRKWRLPSYSYEKLLWRNMIVNSAVYRRDAYLRAGGYAEDMKHGFEDWEFYIRLLDEHAVVREIGAPLFYYRVKEQSRSSEQIASGKIETSTQMIYERNRAVYDRLATNPIATFSARMRDFAPTQTGRYKRQIRYLHAAYLSILVVLVASLIVMIGHLAA